MASRKEQKEQARIERERIEREQSTARARRRRLTQLGLAAAAAAVVVVVAILISSGGGDGGGGEVVTGESGDALVADVSTALAGIEQDGTRLGAANAPVTMDYYGDLQCPVCAEFTKDGLAQAIQAFVKPGTMKVVYRSLETATQDPDVYAKQQSAAIAAGRQNRLWQYIELFYRQQGQENSGFVTDEFLRKIAEQVPEMDEARWETDRKAATNATALQADEAEAQKAGADGTPTLVIRGPKGERKLGGAASADEIRGAVEAVS